MGIDWKYQDKDFTEDDVKDFYGFVYIITNTINNKKYVGKKFFYSVRTKVIAGKKKKVKSQSDWKNYYGSSDNLKKDVIEFGKDKFTREILHLCTSKGECGYLEAKEQFSREVMEKEDFYNIWIMCRVRRSHIKEYNARNSE